MPTEDGKKLAFEAGDNEIAATTNPRLAATDSRWNPDSTKVIGTPPVNGVGGERGSSAFNGDDVFEADGTIADDTVPNSHYPLKGVDYWEGTAPTGNHA